MAIRERQVKNKRNSNGVLTGKPGTVYDVNLKYYQNGVQKSYGKRGFVTKKDALQHEAEMRLKLQAPSFSSISQAESRQKLRDYLNTWVENYKPNLRPSTYHGYCSHIRNQIIPILGEVRLNALTPAMIDDMIWQLFDRDLSQSTVRYCQRILSVSLGCAVKYGYIDTNPAKNIITKFSKTSNVPDPYTIPQLQQFFAIVTRHVLTDEEAFAEEIQSRWNAQQEAKPQQKKSDIKQLQKRYGELSDLVRSLYENYVSGILPERQYRQLMKQYDDEQAAIEVKISELEEHISEESKTQLKIDQFIALVHKYQESDEVSDVMFREMIDKIIVHEAEGVGNARTQQVDIYFNYAGQINIAYTEEELAQMKEQEERAQAERIARSRTWSS